MNNRVCIVNYASGHHYRMGQQRLIRQLDHVLWKGRTMLWAEQLPPNSPPHPRKTQWAIKGYTPYAFKVYALEAARLAGNDIVIWLDASMVPIRPLEPLIEHIAEHGYWFPLEGWTVGQWCADEPRHMMALGWEESFDIPMVTAGAMGLDLRHTESSWLLEAWLGMCRAGVFRGPWTNKGFEASTNPRVRGHRHDMTCLSVLAHRRGMTGTPIPKFYSVGDSKLDYPPEVCIVADGNY